MQNSCKGDKKLNKLMKSWTMRWYAERLNCSYEIEIQHVLSNVTLKCQRWLWKKCDHNFHWTWWCCKSQYVIQLASKSIKKILTEIWSTTKFNMQNETRFKILLLDMQEVGWAIY